MRLPTGPDRSARTRTCLGPTTSVSDDVLPSPSPLSDSLLTTLSTAQTGVSPESSLATTPTVTSTI